MSDTVQTFRMRDFEKCAQNGWGVGTFLIGDEGYGPAVIEIVYLSRATTLCRTHAERGREVRRLSEHAWTLSCRDWEEVPPLRKPSGESL